MAVPKKRTTPSKRGMRRSHHRLSPPTLTKCANCGATRPTHRVCPSCGYYRGRKVIQVKTS